LIRIGTALGGILYESVPPAEAMQRLLTRDLRPEEDDSGIQRTVQSEGR
jgi:hypothetical protein